MTNDNGFMGRKEVLQLIQHIISLSSGITLRLLNKNAPTNVYNYLSNKHDDFKQTFDSQDKFNKFILSFDTNLHNDNDNLIIRHLATKWYFHSKYMWDTLPSNPHIYQRKLIQNVFIKVLCRLEHLKQILKNDRKKVLTPSNCVTGLSTLYIRIPILDNNFLVVGYVWETVQNNIEETYKKINNYINCMLKIQNNFEYDFKFSESSLKILSTQKSTMPEAVFYDKATKITKCIDKILYFYQTNNSIVKKLRKKDWINIANMSFFLLKEHVANTLEEILYLNKCELVLTSNLEYEIPQYVFNIQRGYDYDIIKYDDYIKTRNSFCISTICFFPTSPIIDKTERLATILDVSYGNFIESVFAKRKQREYEYLLELHDLTGSVDFESSLIKKIIVKAVNFVLGDCGSYMRYNPQEKSLILEEYCGEQFVGKLENFRSQIRSWRKKPDREISSVYRALDERVSVVVSNSDSSNCKQLFDEDIFSSISVPVTYHERVLGVIHIDGFTSEQFVIDDVTILNQFAKHIAPILYDYELNIGREKISEISLTDTLTEKQKYKEICRQITNIFHSAAASIWLEDEIEIGLYKLLNSYKYDCKKPKKIINYLFRADEENCISALTINNKKVQLIADINKTNNLKFKDNLLAHGYESYMSAPIIVPFKELPIGTLSIYDYDMRHEYLAISENLLLSIGKFVGLAITTIQQLKKERSIRVDKMRHEVRQSIVVAEKTTHRLKGNINQIQIGSLFDHVDTLFSDILGYLKNAKVTLDGFIEEANSNTVNRDDMTSFLKIMKNEPKEIVDLRNLVNSIIHGEINEIRKKNITFRVIGQRFNFYWYKQIIFRVISNIINNAIKYTTNNFPTIVIDIKSDQYLNEIYFENVGIEIPIEDHGLIFREKYRTEPSKRCAKGEGLGLYIASRLANDWGGSVSLKYSRKIPELPSCYKTCFTVTFPKTSR